MSSPIDIDKYFDRLFEEFDRTEEMLYRTRMDEEEEDHRIEDYEQRLWEECWEDQATMDYGIEQIDIDEMNKAIGPCTCCAKDPSCCAKSVGNDTVYSDYVAPEEIKQRGGENYHINKQKDKTSPKSERRKLREKRTKDMGPKESRCHKKMIDTN